jgi:hypothetical protein
MTNCGLRFYYYADVKTRIKTLCKAQKIFVIKKTTIKILSFRDLLKEEKTNYGV